VHSAAGDGAAAGALVVGHLHLDCLEPLQATALYCPAAAVPAAAGLAAACAVGLPAATVDCLVTAVAVHVAARPCKGPGKSDTH
jgi:hypothetical protein